MENYMQSRSGEVKSSRWREGLRPAAEASPVRGIKVKCGMPITGPVPMFPDGETGENVLSDEAP